MQNEVNKQPTEVEKDLKNSGKDKGSYAKLSSTPLSALEPEAQQEEKTSLPGTFAETVQKKPISPVSQESRPPTNQSILKEGVGQISETVTKQEEKSQEMPVYSYNPVGKIDPFRPILNSRVGRKSTDLRKVLDKTAPLTPLQKIEIDQVKLVGIIVSPKGNKAIVEDASGKGYILTKGTYIGTNFGKVIKILDNKVVVCEEVEDYITGQIKSREVTLEPPQKYENGSMQ
jgi:type IV pilus assembly protein PilP